MSLFGPPLIFCTPNLADTKQPLLLVVQGVPVALDESIRLAPELPKYREMLRRVAADPVGQTVVFELMMRLFLLHAVVFECTAALRTMPVAVFLSSIRLELPESGGD